MIRPNADELLMGILMRQAYVDAPDLVLLAASSLKSAYLVDSTEIA